MLYASDSSPSTQLVITLRLANGANAFPHTASLKAQGLQLIECATPEDAASAALQGCRVGLLTVTEEADLVELERYRSFVSNSRMSWVGLVTREVIALPRMREFIGQHLFNFITMPAASEHVALMLRHAWGMAFMRDLAPGASGTLAGGDDAELIGSTPDTQQLLSQIQKVARTDAPVLVSGPSGVGKERAARAIHQRSTRGKSPFVAVNCGTIPPEVLDSEIFGEDKEEGGSSAVRRKTGQIRGAQGGTLFLDDIGDLSADMQAKLLRFMQQNGANASHDDNAAENNIAVRVIASSSIDLEDAVRQGKFREDLFYRVSVVRIDMPPLADRGKDIEEIAKYYFTRFASVHNRSLRGFSKAAMDAMLSHSWPGNVRELVNRVQRAAVMAEGRFIQPGDLGFERDTGQKQMMSLQDARAAAESMMIRRALSQSRNQISRAAALLGISRVTLYRLIEKYNIRPELTHSARTAFMSKQLADMDAYRK